MITALLAAYMDFARRYAAVLAAEMALRELAGVKS